MHARLLIFVAELIKGQPASAAAVCAGYSIKSAPQQASRLLRNAKVQALLNVERAKLAHAAKADAEKIIKTLLEVIDWDPASAIGINQNGQLYLKPGSEKNLRYCESVEHRQTIRGATRIKLQNPDRLRAIELLIQILGPEFFRQTLPNSRSTRAEMDQRVRAALQRHSKFFPLRG